MRIAGAVRVKLEINKNVRKKTLGEETAWETKHVDGKILLKWTLK